MNLEILEHELSLLNGKSVILVKPDFGTVSISYCGTLTATSNEACHVVFHLITLGPAIIFRAEDVSSLEEPSPETAANQIVKIIRLKCPYSYETAIP